MGPDFDFTFIILALLIPLGLFIFVGRLIGWALGISDVRANQRKIISELRAINIRLSENDEEES